MNNERLIKLGRRAELTELRTAKRIEIDLLVSGAQDCIGIRDKDMLYVEKINHTNLLVYTREIDKKSRALAGIIKELAMLESELGINE